MIGKAKNKGHLAPLEHQNGFTLVELLVALAIFSFLSAAGVLLLRSSVDTQAQVAERLSDVAVINRLTNAMSNDLAQIANRPSRNENGDTAPLFNTNEQGFSFVRHGLSIADGGARPTMQKVRYAFEDGTWQRSNWPFLDGATANEPAVLVSDIQEVSIRYRDADGNWRDDWTSDEPTQYPRAVELNITQIGLPNITMQYMLGPQVRPAPLAEADEL